MYESCIFGTKGIKTPAVWNGKRKQKNVIEGIDLMGEEELRDVIRKFIKESDGGYDVLYEDKPLKNDLHPTMKPVKLLAKLIRNSSSIGGRVIDMFGGSGGTLIACEQLNRVCYTMELDAHYCDVIIKRWENLTGEKAVLIND